MDTLGGRNPIHCRDVVYILEDANGIVDTLVEGGRGHWGGGQESCLVQRGLSLSQTYMYSLVLKPFSWGESICGSPSTSQMAISIKNSTLYMYMPMYQWF